MDRFADKFRGLALTLLRIGLGLVFMYHGLQKVNNLGGTANAFVHMGFPAWTAYMIAVLESAGGALLVLGLLTRPIALLLAGDLLVALVKVQLPATHPIWNVGRYQLEMLLSGAAFLYFAYGAGPISVDRLLGGRPKGKRATAG